MNTEIMRAKKGITKEGIVKQYEDSGIKVIIEIPIKNEEKDRNRIKDIKRMLNSELLLQISK